MSFSFPLSSLLPAHERGHMEALFKPGSRYNAKVISVLPDGRVRLFLAGQSLLLRPEKPLAAGISVEVRVYAGPKGLVLEIRPEGPGTGGMKFPDPSSPPGSRTVLGPRTMHAARPLHRMAGLLFTGMQSGERISGRGGEGVLPPRVSLGAGVPDIRASLAGLVRALLQDSPGEGAVFQGPGPGEEGDTAASLSLAAFAEQEGGKEGLETLLEFRESVAKNFLEQGRLMLPLPFEMDGLFRMGRFFLDMGGSPEEKSRDSRILRAGIRLDLDSLGHVRADALLFGKELQLGFAVETADVLSLLEEEMPELVRRLEALGLRVLPVRLQLLEDAAPEEGEAGAGDWEVIV